jgi:hypothetical protein
MLRKQKHLLCQLGDSKWCLVTHCKVASNEGRVADRLEQERIEAYYPQTIGESRDERPCTWAAITSRTSWSGEPLNGGAAFCAIARRPTHIQAAGWEDHNA